MKQRLLSVLAFVGLGLGTTMAQTWTAPVAPTNPAVALLENAVDPEAEGNYFVMNVGEAQFLTGANVWATQISLTANSNPTMQITLDASATYEGSFVMRRTNDSKDVFYGDHGRENGYNPPAGRNHLFRSGDDGYVDMNNQGGDLFVFNITDNGYYYIQSSPDEGKFANATEEYAGSTGAGKYVSFTKTVEDENIEWVFIPVESIPEDYASQVEAYSAAVALYEARLALYTTLTEAATYGVDYAAASEVYNNESATIEELTAAKAALQPAVDKAAVLAAIASSSQENPLDITKYVLTNADFSNGQTGWTITEGMGQNLQVQGAKYTNENVDPVVTIQNFIEAWFPTSVGPLKDGVICQNVTGLPEGRYRIEADVMAVWQGDSPYNADYPDPTGIYLFYNNGKFTLHSEAIYTDNGVPDHFVFDFDYDGSETMTIGLMAQSTNQNWMGMDNLKLFAIGEMQSPPSFLALQGLVADSQSLYDEVENTAAQQSVKETFIAQFEASLKVAESNPEMEQADHYTAVFNTLSAARTAYLASIESYKALDKLIEAMQASYEAYKDKANFADYCNELLTLQETYQTAYEEGSATSEEITSYQESFSTMFTTYLQGLFDKAAKEAEEGISLEEPLDISSLFEHLSYAYSSTATAFADGYPAENPVWMNDTKTANFKTMYGTAEVWNAGAFNINRTLENLPNGRYTVKVRAFHRKADNATNYTSYFAGEYDDAPGAYLYAANTKAPIINLAELATTTPANSANDTNVGTDTEPIYVVNNQLGAYNLFTNANGETAEQADMAYVEASATVKDGTLKFGIEGTEYEWTVWYNFELYYTGAASADELDEDIEALMIKAQDLLDNGDGVNPLITTDVIDGLTDAINTGTEAIGTDAATKEAAINTLEAAIAFANENLKVTAELLTLKDERQTQVDNLSEYAFDDESIPTALAAIDEAMAADGFETHAEMVEYLNILKNNWYVYLFSRSDLAEASEENPIDMSMLIANASFDDSWNGWTYTTSKGTPSIESGSGNCAEFWNTGTFDIYQELPYLKDGYWTLSVDALYRPGNSTDIITMLNSEAGIVLDNEYLYITGTDLNKSKKVLQWSDLKNAIAYTEVPNADDPTVNDKVFAAEDQAAADIVLETALAVKADNVNFLAPNNRTQFKKFIEAGRYNNQITFQYTGGGENKAVKFGLKLEDEITQGSCWCPFDDYKLIYLGTEEPTGIEGIASAEKKVAETATAIYSIDGRQQGQLRRGINIVRTTSGAVRKVLVK